MRQPVDIGILLSTDGAYRHVAASALAGMRDAINEVNADPAFDFTLNGHHHNPQGQLAGYGTGMAQLMAQGIRHLFGTITSASRKEIIPDLEQQNALLWYACPYEGYESSEHVIYLGGCPNQTLLPILRLALATFGTRGYLIGSNYVWGWESNRIAREIIEAAHGEVTGEKYLHLAGARPQDLIGPLLDSKPDFVLNNLVGESSYDFLQQLDAACLLRGLELPVLSCNLSEAELGPIGDMRALRLLSCGPFFEAADPAFCAAQRRRHRGIMRYSHHYTGGYLSVMLFARARRQTGCDDPQRICEALYRDENVTFMGPMKISRRNNHCHLPCHIAELRHGAFRLIHSEPQRLAPDPYLTATDLRGCLPARPHPGGHLLRMVK